MPRRVYPLCLLVALIVSSCASEEKNLNTPEGAFAYAEEFDKQDRYEEAIKRYQDVRNKFPYSTYATKSELAIADVYFRQESFAEAQTAYESFREMHPKHEKIDYVVFRIGLSLFNQLPETFDRDLSLAPKAIEVFDELIKKFPNSAFVAEARDKRTQALNMLAAKEEYVADFYLRAGEIDAAVSRFDSLFRKYPRSNVEPSALVKAIRAAKKLGDNDKVSGYFKILKTHHPNSAEYREAKDLLQ
ncbi:MAG: outer membrane protein assembly factor BamD [Bdellovibrionaceae bacterium]|nr:outer membrane protein assembly factor BamD [Pseudobdellovibrionaceae bacterium]